MCDGSNGVVGVDCLHSRDYPRKLDGTPYAPHGDHFGSYVQLDAELPLCDGSNGVLGVDCVSV